MRDWGRGMFGKQFALRSLANCKCLAIINGIAECMYVCTSVCWFVGHQTTKRLALLIMMTSNHGQ